MPYLPQNFIQKFDYFFLDELICLESSSIMVIGELFNNQSIIYMPSKRI